MLRLGPAVARFVRRPAPPVRFDDVPPPVTAFSGLATIAASVAHARRQAAVTVPLLMVQLGLLAVVVLWLVLGTATEQRRGEVAVARLRGQGSAGGRRLLLGELGPVVLAGVPVGVAAALATGAVARHSWLPLDPPFEVPRAFWIGVAGSAVGLALLLVAAVQRVAREPLTGLLRRVPVRRAGWAVGALDPVVIAVSATAVAGFAADVLHGPIAMAAPALLALLRSDLLPVRAALRSVDPRGDRTTLVTRLRPPGADGSTTVAVDPDPFARIALFPGQRASSLHFDRLAAPAVTPIRVVGSALAVSLSAQLATGRAVTVAARMVGPEGIGYLAPLASLTDGRASRTFRASVPCARGCLLTGWSVGGGTATGPPLQGRLEIAPRNGPLHPVQVEAGEPGSAGARRQPTRDERGQPSGDRGRSTDWPAVHGAGGPGELQLSAVAAAVAAVPGLLLADEPTSQLDHEARDRVLDTLARVNREVGTTVVLVTHDPDVAGSMARKVTIRDGRIGGEGRRGEEYAVVTADGFLPLPSQALEDLPPGTLVRLHREDDGYRLLLGHDDDTADPADPA